MTDENILDDDILDGDYPCSAFVLGVSDLGIEAAYNVSTLKDQEEQYLLDVLGAEDHKSVNKPGSDFNIWGLQMRARMNQHRNYSIVAINLPYESTQELYDAMDSAGSDAEHEFVKLIKERGEHIGF